MLTYPAPLGAGGVRSIPANSNAQNVPSFRRWRFEMKSSSLYTADSDLYYLRGVPCVTGPTVSERRNGKVRKTPTCSQAVLSSLVLTAPTSATRLADSDGSSPSVRLVGNFIWLEGLVGGAARVGGGG